MYQEVFDKLFDIKEVLDIAMDTATTCLKTPEVVSEEKFKNFTRISVEKIKNKAEEILGML